MNGKVQDALYKTHGDLNTLRASFNNVNKESARLFPGSSTSINHLKKTRWYEIYNNKDK